MSIKLPDSVRRALRTFLQGFIAVFAVSLLGWLQSVATWAQCSQQCGAFPDVTVLGKAAIAAFVAAVIAMVAWLQNHLEDKSRFPALLKAPPSPGANPVPNRARHRGQAGQIRAALNVTVTLVLLALIALTYAWLLTPVTR